MSRLFSVGLDVTFDVLFLGLPELALESDEPAAEIPSVSGRGYDVGGSLHGAMHFDL